MKYRVNKSVTDRDPGKYLGIDFTKIPIERVNADLSEAQDRDVFFDKNLNSVYTLIFYKSEKEQFFRLHTNDPNHYYTQEDLNKKWRWAKYEEFEKNLEIIGTSGYVYTNDETPEERLRNKLSVLFMVVETGKCDPELKEQAIKVMPDILMHLEDIEPFYKKNMSQNKINAKIVADSISKEGHRITTMEVIFPRFILAEFNTHRMFSRNSASSRAIPFKKMLKTVKESPFIPIAWQKDHSGMQGTEYLVEEDVFSNMKEWLQARDYAIKQATYLNNRGVTKQLANRLLEPYMYHKVLVTFTESENFFNLRCPHYEDPFGFVYKSKKDFMNNTDPDMHPRTELGWMKLNKGMGEIHIMDLAEKMWDAMNESTPKILKPGQWHIPYGETLVTDGDFYEFFSKNVSDTIVSAETHDDGLDKMMCKIATARCARLSYQTLGDEPKIDYEADLKLFDTLLSSGHLSPFEHIGRAMTHEELKDCTKSYYDSDGDMFIDKGWSNNFKGFIQYRALLEQ